MNSILYASENVSSNEDDDVFTVEDYKVIEEAEEIIKDNNPDFKPIIKRKHT